MRATIGLVLVTAVLAAGCDRRSADGGQGNVSTATSAAATPGVSADEVQPAAGGGAAGGAPAATSPAGRIDRSHHGQPAPGYAFQDASGKTVTLAAFRGKPVLLNLWATWCGPCVRELPTLAALSKQRGTTFQVVALSQDSNPAVVAPFMASHGAVALKPYTDGKMAWLPAVTSNLPTTLLIDANGREVWRTLGDLDWTGPVATQALAEAR